ncbi:MAG: CPBP family intramembrane metalloprotease [Isosphaeraceae bacterium]|nr:CPBP family intramembrane metalloprotease [Isosphaeraceae bacterium]
MGLRPAGWRWASGGVALGLLCAPLMGMAAKGVMKILGRPEVNPQVASLAPALDSPVMALILALTVVVLVPLGEELFFRGILYGWLRRRWGVATAGLLSAVAFGLVHIDPAVIMGTIVLGLVAALAYEASGSLWTAVLVHATNNGVALAVMYALLTGKGPG